MTFTISLWLIAITGLIGSYLAWRIEWISQSRWFRWGGLALFNALLVLMRLSMETIELSGGPGLAFSIVLSIAAACICWAPFIAFFMMHALVGLARSAVSLDNIRSAPSYSQAEAAAVQKDFQKALLLYHHAAMEHPEEPEPCRRMGELFLELKLPDDAIASFQDAQKRQKDTDDQLPIVFRISETLADCKGDVQNAIKAIEDFVSQHPEVEGREYADERLRRLRARMAGNSPAERESPK
jgi:tetratricopeptide (TPR) repeat protein